jgi:hypothetical protein
MVSPRRSHRLTRALEAKINARVGPLPHRPSGLGRAILDTAGQYPIIPELFRELGTAEVLGDGPYLCLLVMVTRSGDL